MLYLLDGLFLRLNLHGEIFRYTGWDMDVDSSDAEKSELCTIMDHSFEEDPIYKKWRLISDDKKIYSELGGRILYLLVDGKCVSMLTLHTDSSHDPNPRGNITYVCNVGTHKDYRRKGYMTKLFNELYRFCHTNSIRCLKLFVDDTNTTAQKFYRTQEFIETRQSFTRDGVTEKFMLKMIK